MGLSMRLLTAIILVTLTLLSGAAVAQPGLPDLDAAPAVPTLDPAAPALPTLDPAAPEQGTPDPLAPSPQTQPTANANGGDPIGQPVNTGADSLWGDIDLGTGAIIGVGLTIAAVAAAVFFMGGAKFVNSGNVLENDARRSIFEYIQVHPGVHLRAAAGALDLSTTNVLWHLRKLEDANLVTSRKFEGYKVFYPVEGGVETKRKALAASVLKNDNAALILDYVISNPSAHQREIARALGVNHGTIRWHLRKLEEAELISPLKKEHTTHYYVSELGRESLRDVVGRAFTPPAPAAPPTARVPEE